jgi:hypothetical protein
VLQQEYWKRDEFMEARMEELILITGVNSDVDVEDDSDSEYFVI